MKLLVIGAAGFLGGCLMRAHDIRFERLALDRIACDVTDPASVRSAFEKTRPEAVALTAALADVDRCEREPDLARAINVNGAENVARECAQTGARLLFTSAAAVFDGDAEEYTETASPNPLSVYGKTKAEAEDVIRKHVPDTVIVRLSLALGSSPYRGTNALLDKLESAFRHGNPIYAPANESRNAIDSGSLTQWILDLAYAPEAKGIFHLGASDAMSRYEITGRLAEAMGFSRNLVIAHDHLALDRAPRGRRHLLVPTRIRQFSAVAVPTCAQAIERCVKC
jgi:dTDP-4-dehydrorhamnose reductase